MSLLFRMLYVWFLSFVRELLPVGPSTSNLNLMVLPNDLDINRHMNNGRYLTICDLNRLDLFIRTGLAKEMIKNGWMPIITEHSMSYKRPLKLWHRYTATMILTHWDDRAFYMEHRFESGDTVFAEGKSTGVIRGKSGIIPPEQVMTQLLYARRLAEQA